MPVSATTLSILMDAGLSGEKLISAVAAIDADMAALSPKPERTARQERNARYYAKKRDDRLNKTSEQDVLKPSESDLIETPNEAPSRARSLCEDNIIKNKTSNDVLQKAEPKSNRGTRITGCWSPEPQDWHFAISELGAEAADRELAKFRDFWIGKPGAGGLKLDWSATWRNWVRKAADDRKARAGPRAGPPTSKATQLSQALRAAARFQNERNYDTSPNLIIDATAVAREAG